MSIGKIAPFLLGAVQIIKTDASLISSKWVKIKSVEKAFETYSVPPSKFIHNFGIPIIEHFVAVIKEEREVGNCPIMTKLVQYLIEKDITPREVFDICMGLRRVLVHHILEKSNLKTHPIEVMDEISTIFDANLSGVMEVFTSMAKQRQEYINQARLQQKKFNQISKIINFINTKILIVQSGIVVMANKPFFETVGVKSLKEFYQLENNFEFLRHVEEFSDEFDVNNINAWIQKVYDSKKSFKAEIYDNKYKKAFVFTGKVSLLPDTYPQKYIISLTRISPSNTNEVIVQQKELHDDLTGLYNFEKFESLIGTRSKGNDIKEKKFALIVIDIPDLQYINREYDYATGNEVILKVAENIKQLISPEMIAARVEGGRFVIVSEYEDAQLCYDWACKLHMQINRHDYDKFVSVSSFNFEEKIKKSFIHGYKLINDARKMSRNIVHTDLKNIEFKDILKNQEKFTSRLKGSKSLETSFFYKELPLRAENKIYNVNSDTIEVGLSARQLMVCDEDSITYFEIPSFGFVKAYVKSINYAQKKAVFENFSLDVHSPLQRKKLRVAAEKNIDVKIIYDEYLIDGALVDLNENHVALELKRKKNLHESLLVGLEYSITIGSHETTISSNATIQRVEKIESGYKIILLCHYNLENEKRIYQYISKRQIDIVKEMQEKSFL